jgi:uncharacterized protein
MALPARNSVLLVLAAIAAIILPFLPSVLPMPAIRTTLSRLVCAQQAAWLIAAPLVLLNLILLGKTGFAYLRINRRAGSVQPVRWLGIKATDNWARQGWQLLAVITTVTAIVIFIQIPVTIQALQALPSFALPILLLSLSNSLAEELIYRHSIVTALDATPWRRFAALFSGILFGGAHYFGAPGGFPGVLMAGLLGWLLAKSMQETRGFFWAWLIHFIQDVVIISAMFLQEVQK